MNIFKRLALFKNKSYEVVSVSRISAVLVVIRIVAVVDIVGVRALKDSALIFYKETAPFINVS